MRGGRREEEREREETGFMKRGSPGPGETLHLLRSSVSWQQRAEWGLLTWLSDKRKSLHLFSPDPFN